MAHGSETSICEVPGALHTQGAALDAAAALCRYVDGDLVTEVPLLCERSLALMLLDCN